MQPTIVAFGVTFALASIAAIGSGQAQPVSQSAKPQLTAIHQATPAPAPQSFVPSVAYSGSYDSQITAQPERRPLFKIGNLPATVWAPVPPPYDGRANRNAAANPLWLNDEAM